MAVSLGGKSNFGFFAKVSPAAEEMSKALTDSGATVEVQFQALKVTYHGQQAMCPLPANSTAVIKGTVPEPMQVSLRATVEKFLLAQWVKLHPHDVYPAHWGENAWKASNPTPPQSTPKSEAKLTFGSEGEAGVSAPLQGTSESIKTALKDFKMKHPGQFMAIMSELIGGAVNSQTQGKIFPKGTAGTAIPLSQATMLNQPVKGTSANSTYRVIGIGDRIRLAMRYEAGSLSVRVEGPLTTVEKGAFKELGFTDHGMKGYLSCHYDLQDVPVVRVLGCIFFHPALKFNARIDSMEQIG